MNQWLVFLFGTPQRAIRSIVIGVVLLMIVSENFRYAVLTQVENFVAAIMGPLLLLAIIGFAFRKMLGPLWSNRKH